MQVCKIVRIPSSLESGRQTRGCSMPRVWAMPQCPLQLSRAEVLGGRNPRRRGRQLGASHTYAFSNMLT